MTIGHVTFQPAHLSDAGYYQDQAAECEERAYRSQLTDVQALYRNLAGTGLSLPGMPRQATTHMGSLTREVDCRSRIAPSTPWGELSSGGTISY